MDFLFDYLLFAAKFLTAVVLLSIPLLLVVVARASRRTAPDVEIEVRNLNEQRQGLQNALVGAILTPKSFKQHMKAAKAEHKAALKAAPRPRSFVCRFDGDLRASAVSTLREEISAILAVASEHDEVVVVLESGGGTVHGYGLAASQLQRVRDRGVRLRVVVDRIAASGGYMMACVADRIIAAPFAIIGSIGVVAQIPNFNRLLKKHDIDFEQVTAGEYKRTLTLFGENTDEDRAKFQADMDDAHELFKTFVAEHRADLDLARVSTGEWWFASRARELGLVDELGTSDEVITHAIADRDVFEIQARRPKRLLNRLRERAAALLG